MERLKQSLTGILSGVLGYLVNRGGEEDFISDYSELDCQSDCSHCDSANRSISLISSKRSCALQGESEADYLEQSLGSKQGSTKKLRRLNVDEESQSFVLEDDMISIN